jgi:hypothetical protein
MFILFQNICNLFKLGKYLLLLSLGFLWFGCHNASENKVSNNTNTPSVDNTVINIISSAVKPLKLPFIDTCYDTLPTEHPNFPDSLLKFKVRGQIVGKVCETKNYIALLYSISADVQLPVLHTFNTNGEKISSLKLFIGNSCGENEASSGLSTAIITKDLHIILRDSTQTFERDKKKYEKKKNIQLFKKYEEYRIDSTGRIIPLGSKLTEEITIRFFIV